MNTAILEDIQTAEGQGGREWRRMGWMALWTALLGAMGLAHVWLPMKVRDLDMQRSRYMKEATDLQARENELRSAVSQLRSDDRRLELARELFDLHPVAPDRRDTWEMPAEKEEMYIRVCMEIEKARGAESERNRPQEPWLVKVLATILPLWSARPAADSTADGK